MTSKRNKAYRDLEMLIELSGSSPRALTQDGYGKPMMVGTRGHVYADRKGFVIYVFAANEGRRWSRAKRDLVFCTVPQDYEEEGVFRLDRMPTKAEAVLIRETIEARRKGPPEKGDHAARHSTAVRHPEDPFEVYLPDAVRDTKLVGSASEKAPISSVKRGSRAKSPWRNRLFPDSLGPLEVAQAGISGPADVIAVEIRSDHPDWRTVVSPDGIEVQTRRVKLAKPPKPHPWCMTCGTAVNPKVTRFCSEACREAFDKGAEPFEPAADLPIAA
jgi:hypothetical protein